MAKLGYVVFVMLVFLTGWFSSSLFAMISAGKEQPINLNNLSLLSSGEPQEKASPGDHISEDSIHVYDNKVILDLKDAHWSSFTDTNSMDPTFDAGANGLEIKPASSDDIKVGDIVSYQSDYADGIIVHRVISTGNDENGWYAIIKGDNNPSQDPGKIRFSQIFGIVVGVLY